MRSGTNLWAALGTLKAVRVISIGMLIYLLILGGLTYGYAKVSGCLAKYADQSASSTAARAAAATQDRMLNDAEGQLEDIDRSRYAADQGAMATALQILLRPESTQPARAKAFVDLLKVNQETTRVLAVSAAERDQIRQQRRQVEEDRRRNPPPAPPSQTC